MQIFDVNRPQFSVVPQYVDIQFNKNRRYGFSTTHGDLDTRSPFMKELAVQLEGVGDKTLPSSLSKYIAKTLFICAG